MNRSGKRTAAQTFATPALLALLTIIGLGAGLMGSGAFDVLAALALAIPAGLCWWKLCRD